ncbi:hypothetical protein POPTR_003G185710v4 [Populus trichocarpa]|uniref:Uncharacterized protein n=1 Tax=Populus trichocarpa TaxID=3694 RepID=A0ACC0TAA4_POPTR|nr:hypothetical protein POPTR_003G185710v4 [Populus trichocarpa]
MNSPSKLRRSFCMLSQMLKMKLNVTIQIKSKYQAGKFPDILVYCSQPGKLNNMVQYSQPGKLWRWICVFCVQEALYWMNRSSVFGSSWLMKAPHFLPLSVSFYCRAKVGINVV